MAGCLPSVGALASGKPVNGHVGRGGAVVVVVDSSTDSDDDDPQAAAISVIAKMREKKEKTMRRRVGRRVGEVVFTFLPTYKSRRASMR